MPGVATWFATVCRECPAGCGVLAKSREGRVVKVEGNPDHPVNRGALCARGQASLLGTYDPDRIPGPRAREGAVAGARSPSPTRRSSSSRRSPPRARPAPGRIAMVTQLETGTFGRLADDWLKAVGGRRPARLRDVRARGPPRGEPRRLRDRRDPPARVRGRADDPVARCGLPRDVDLARRSTPSAFRRAHALREGHAARVIHVEPRYSMTAANADEWIASAAGLPRRAIALALLRLVLEVEPGPGLAGEGGRGPDRGRPHGGGRGGREAERRARGQARSTWRRPSRRARRAWSWRAASRRAGGADAAIAVAPAELRPRERRPDRPLRAELGPVAGEPLRGHRSP